MNLSQMTDAEVLFTISDLMTVIENQELTVREGGTAPKLGTYWDDLYAAQGEMNARRAGKVAA